MSKIKYVFEYVPYACKTYMLCCCSAANYRLEITLDYWTNDYENKPYGLYFLKKELYNGVPTFASKAKLPFKCEICNETILTVEQWKNYENISNLGGAAALHNYIKSLYSLIE